MCNSYCRWQTPEWSRRSLQRLQLSVTYNHHMDNQQVVDCPKQINSVHFDAVTAVNIHYIDLLLHNWNEQDVWPQWLPQHATLPDKERLYLHTIYISVTLTVIHATQNFDISSAANYSRTHQATSIRLLWVPHIQYIIYTVIYSFR